MEGGGRWGEGQPPPPTPAPWAAPVSAAWPPGRAWALCRGAGERAPAGGVCRPPARGAFPGLCPVPAAGSPPPPLAPAWAGAGGEQRAGAGDGGCRRLAACLGERALPPPPPRRCRCPREAAGGEAALPAETELRGRPGRVPGAAGVERSLVPRAGGA